MRIQSQKYILFLILPLFLYACSATEHLQDGQSLLKSNVKFKRAEERVEVDSTIHKGLFRFLKVTGSATLDEELLASSVKTRPNRRMLWPKTYLHLYNLGRTLQIYEFPIERAYKFFFPKSYLVDSIAGFLVNVAGEPPVLVDTLLLNKDRENLKSVYFSRGYFSPEIYYEIDTLHKGKSKKANVNFIIKENSVFIIDTVEYNIPVKNIRDICLTTREKSFLKPGEPYNEENFNKERGRISNLMRDFGYFNFGPSRTSFRVDTSWHSGRRTPLNPKLKNYKTLKITVDIPDPLRVFKIRDVVLQIEPSKVYFDDIPYVIYPGQVDPEFRKELGLSHRVLRDSNWVTIRAYQRALKELNLDFLIQQIAVKPGEVFSAQNEAKTMRRLQELGIFRFISVRHQVADSLQEIDIIIETSLAQKFQLKVGFEGFSTQNRLLSTANLPGLGGEVNFLNKKLFKGGELLQLTGRGNISFYQPGKGELLQTFFELGISGSLNFPRILFPFARSYNWARFNPKTKLVLNADTQQRVEFDRTVVGLDWNYSWFHNSLHRKNRSTVSLLNVNFIQSVLLPAFENQIDSLKNGFLRQLLLLDYQPRFSSKFSYKFTHSDYMSTRTKVTKFIEPVFEFGGNLPFLIDRFFGAEHDVRDNKIGNISYGQWVKFTIEAKVYIPTGDNSEIVARFFSGVADPWNFTSKVPFDARFFSGGTNSMRGWQSNTLGPGIFQREKQSGEDLTSVEYLVSPGGELVFESNLEYRFNVNSFIELAVFNDVGNVWFLPSGGFEFPDGKLSPQTLHFGWDAGLGLRFDFSFFVFRIDVAQKLYDPARVIYDANGLKTQSGFVITSGLKDLGGQNFQLNFGIGYPF
ncbi:MAG: BamA/TamA family outer membrane protein [Bacteroidia bacterium]|nr:BamA/TamA family outer membrane protein [Bacteroidia bacterium]